MARRFFLPINVVAVPEGDHIDLKAINDTAARATIGLTVRAVDANGRARTLLNADSIRTQPDQATLATRIALDALRPNEFLFFSWTAEDGRPLGENDYFPRPYKAYDIADAKVTAKWLRTEDGPVLTLRSDAPAMFVTASVDVPGYFSDNAITLLPGREARLTFTPRRNARVTQKALSESLRVRHLRQTY